MKAESILTRGKYKIGRVREVKKGIDENVRRAVVEYRICDGSVDKFPNEFKTTEMAIHSLCVIVPAGYTNSGVEADLNMECQTNK